MNKYPEWIDGYAKVIHTSFTNMVPGNWGPIDIFPFVRGLEGTLTAKLHTTIRQLKESGVRPVDLVHTFPSSSSLRANIFYLAHEYQGSDHTQKTRTKEVMDFFVELLFAMYKKDPWGMESSIIYSEEEAHRILNETPWAEGERQIARELGKLSNSGSALAYSLYRDFFPQEGYEIRGPYDTSEKFGPGSIFIVRDFVKMKPVELWPDIAELKHESLRIYQIYQGVTFRSEWVSMHSVYGGDNLGGLKAYAVQVDGEWISEPEKIKALSEYIAVVATDQSDVYEHMSVAEIKQKTLEWLCYSYYDFFKFAKTDWRPTAEMQAAVMDKDFPERTDLPSFPSYDEFVASTDWEVYWLKELYQA